MTPRASWWHYAGIVLVVAVVVCGLAVLAFIVLAFLAMGSMGSNK